VLASIAVADVLPVRYFILPGMSQRAGVRRESMAALGYAFALAPGAYAVVGAIVTGSGLLALPLGALGVWAWLLVWGWMRES
jgi:hypothetical protein